MAARNLLKGIARPLAVLASAITPGIAVAQAAQQPFQGEGRIDAIVSQHTAVHAAYGMSVPMGLYLRAGLVLGAGVGRQGVDSRADLISRFSFDPFRQSRWAPYAGGGVSARINSTAEGDAKGYLLFFLGIEGPLSGSIHGWVPAFEIGLGGGARVGVIARRGIRARR